LQRNFGVDWKRLDSEKPPIRTVNPVTTKGKVLEKAVILIVDDEENLLLLLEKILSKQGYQVVTAQNSHDALALAEKRPFQLAILDIKMFPMDGMGLLDEIKSRCPSTPVIMVTAYPTVDTRNECLKKGASTYLTKPVDIQELKSTVASLLAH
jgi:DNA-binding NtrC family response regulator